MNKAEPTSFGVFKPVGHVVISFHDAAAADAAHEALKALAGLDLQGTAVRRYSDVEMLAQIDRDLQTASPLSTIGQEMNLIKAHRVLAASGYHWLVVPVRDDSQALAVADCARKHGAAGAQHYGHWVIDELIEHRGDLPQVAESPDRGLDTRAAPAASAAAPTPPGTPRP